MGAGKIPMYLGAAVVAMVTGCGDDSGRKSCTDTCGTVGDSRCESEAVRHCVSVDGCRLWSEAVPCPAEASCVDGRCVVEEECEDDCQRAGLARCVLGDVQICVRVDGCLLWSETVPCAEEEECIEGRCVREQTCDDECDALQATRCTPAGEAVETCVSVDGCLRWTDPVDCAPGAVCLDGLCQGCAGAAGTFHELDLDVDGEARMYFLHVPDSYRCEEAWPLLVHLHGTVVDNARPEEAYGLDKMVELADAEGFLLVRPRSQSATWSGHDLYQWDVNPGDLDRNAAFVQALLEELGRSYHIDPQRRYASGFSNGTNMAMKLLETLPERFAGYGLIGGGFWWPMNFPPLDLDPPRIFAVTGFRDYMYESLRDLLGALAAVGFPRASLRQRQVDAGHELYGWHMREMWMWMDRGETAPGGELRPPWTADDSFPGAESLLEVEVGPDGALVASGAGGVVWRRDPTGGDWSHSTGLGDGFVHNLTGLCLFPSGRGLVVGEGALALTLDGGLTWSELDPLPDHQQSGFGYAYVIGIGCSAGQEAFTGGYWAAAGSDDGGGSWQASSTPTLYEMSAQVADAAFGDSGTVVAVGYPNYLGRSPDGLTFEPIASPRYDSWYNAVAAAPGGRFWTVGEHGAILHSADDGETWADQSIDNAADLYAVDFLDEHLGLAVGSHGTALLTEDGGAVWQDLSVGLDIFLGDVDWVDDTTAVAVGEDGVVLVLER